MFYNVQRRYDGEIGWVSAPECVLLFLNHSIKHDKKFTRKMSFPENRASFNCELTVCGVVTFAESTAKPILT